MRQISVAICFIATPLTLGQKPRTQAEKIRGDLRADRLSPKGVLHISEEQYGAGPTWMTNTYLQASQGLRPFKVDYPFANVGICGQTENPSPGETKTLEKKDWAGVFPAITTPFNSNLAIDYDALELQIHTLIQAGCRAIVALGLLGEALALTPIEKIEVLVAAKRALMDRAPLIAGISACSTRDAETLAYVAQRAGADGLMVLPPYAYCGDWRGDEGISARHFACDFTLGYGGQPSGG